MKNTSYEKRNELMVDCLHYKEWEWDLVGELENVK